MNALDIPTPPAVAEWLMGEAQSHRMPPLLSVEAQSEDVLVTVDPSESWYLSVWSNLLQVDAARTTACNGCLTAHGEWQGVHVVLTLGGAR